MQDEAKVLSESTQTKIRQLDDEINRATGKDLLVVTESSITGTTQEEAEKIFRREGLNGVLILLVPSQKHLGIVPGRSTEQLFPRSHLSEIRQRMLVPLHDGKYDDAVLEGAEDVRATFVGAAASRPRQTQVYPRSNYAPPLQRSHGWSMLSIVFLVGGAVLLIVVVRAIFGAMSGGGGSYGATAPYGAPVPMGGGGGGSFLGNLAAGVGGAFLGNALYNNFFGHEREGYSNYPTGGGFSDQGSAPAWSGDDGGMAGSGDYADFGGSGSDGGGDWN